MGLFSKLVSAADTVTNFGIGPGVDPTATMSLRCVARIVALADLPDEGGQDEPIQQVSLLRLAVQRPEGEHELCVRQDIPMEFMSTLVPAMHVNVATSPIEPGKAFIRWGNGPGGTTLLDGRLLRFPPPEQWPLPGRIEVYGNRGKRDDALPALRQQRLSVGARLVSLDPTNYRNHGRQQFRVTVETQQGPVQLTVFMPWLAYSRLMFMHSMPRQGAPMILLVSHDGKQVDIDWEATIAQPENWRGGQH